ncbi:unnamed protein product [Dracunculus medinensis]|uniref:Uncharacterized protein n=1 Tax=Dracunculus medinensis TaxID=318479 RepID=A0A0N4U4Q0_DRAME|nr:unnamed protein product [Dracunculus medinensis]
MLNKRNTRCYDNVTRKEWEEFKNSGILRIETILYAFFGQLPLPISLVALTLCLPYTIAIFRCIRSNKIMVMWFEHLTFVSLVHSGPLQSRTYQSVYANYMRYGSPYIIKNL